MAAGRDRGGRKSSAACTAGPGLTPQLDPEQLDAGGELAARRLIASGESIKPDQQGLVILVEGIHPDQPHGEAQSAIQIPL